MSATPDTELSPSPTPADETHDVLDFQAARLLGLHSIEEILDTPTEESRSLAAPFTLGLASPDIPVPVLNFKDPDSAARRRPSTTAVIDAVELADLRQRQHLDTDGVISVQIDTEPLRRPVMDLKLYEQSSFAGFSWKAKTQFASICFLFFQSGWNDGSTGPLLPRIQAVYQVGFTVVSMIFIVSCAGYLVGVMSNVPLTYKLGFGKVVVIGAASQGIGYIIQSAAPPFPVFAASYFFNGFGGALLQAQVGGFTTAMPNAPPKLALVLAGWGAGALASPLVATEFAVLNRWSFLYLCSLGITVADVICLCLAFRFKNQADLFAEMGLPEGETDPSTDNKFWQIMRLRSVHLFALFALVYVGIEVTIGGWIVTFLREVRDGSPATGYVNAGFFGGLTAGRLCHLWVTNKLGERNSMLLYGLLAIVFEIIVWLVPSLIGSAVAVSVVGVLLGPMYPILMNQSGGVFPRWLLTPCIGWVSGFGQAGSAVLPFVTGALAGKFGIGVLQPFLIAMMGLMLALWCISPKPRRRED